MWGVFLALGGLPGHHRVLTDAPNDAKPPRMISNTTPLPLCAALALALPAFTHAKTPDPLAGPAPVTAAMVLDHARDHALPLRAAEQRRDGALWAEETAGAWPEPTLTVQGSPLPIETRNGPVWGSVMVAQPLPYLDVLDAQRAAGAAGARGAEAARRVAALEVEAAALAAFHELALARAEGAINGEMLALARRLLALVEGRVGADRARVVDALQAQVEVARLETVAVELAQRAVTRAAALNVAIGRRVDAPVGPLAMGEAWPVEALDGLLAAAADHPALARHSAAMAAARARLDVAEAQGRPGFVVGAGYTLVGAPEIAMGAPDPGRDGVMLQLGVSLPLWGAYDEARSEAAAAEAAAGTDREAAAEVVALRVVEEAARAEVALARLRLYRETALPLADEALEVLMTAYGADEVGFDRVLAGQRARERFALDAARAEAAFWMARAALAAAVGRPLGEGGGE